MSKELHQRYDQAYTIVRTSIKMARLLRTLGFVLAVIVAIGALFSFGESAIAGFMALLAAAFICVVTLALYTVLVGQAQMMAAICDTAVNTSPHFDIGDKLRIVEQIY